MQSSGSTEYNWSKLDNTANVFPAVSGVLSSNVFRFYVTLREAVNPEALHRAVQRTLQEVPAFAVKMRRGLFWYYFEQNLRGPVVREEYDFPCAPINLRENRGYLFEVTYYHNRINLEVFHALADGVGTMYFLRHLVFYYFKFQHPSLGLPERPEGGGATLEEMTEDAFKKHYSTEQPAANTTLDVEKAFSIRGSLLPLGGLSVLEARMPAAELLALAKGHGATLTEFLTAQYFYSLYEAHFLRSPADKPLKVSVPVNLRAFFPTRSLKNFFIFVRLKINFYNSPLTFEQVLAEVRRQMAEQITREKFLGRIRYQYEMQKKLVLRIAPRPIKNFALRMAYTMGERGYTTSFSNVGIINFGEQLAPFIEDVGLVMAASRNNVLKLTSLTFGDTLVLNFSSTIYEKDIQKHFLRSLADAGIHITLRGNEV